MTNAPNNGWPGNPPPQGPGHPSQWTGGHPTQPPSGFDPTRALGEQPPASVSIDQFRPPRDRGPVLVTVVALVVLALVILGGTSLQSQRVQPSPSPRATSSAPIGPGQPFTTPTGQAGRWEILEQRWLDEGLQLRLRVHADQGAITFRFRAFANSSTEAVYPAYSSATPDIRTGTATGANPVTGYVFFPMAREDATVILTTGTGLQLSALPVKG